MLGSSQEHPAPHMDPSRAGVPSALLYLGACCFYPTCTISIYFGEMSSQVSARACSGSRPTDGSLCLLQILLSMLGVSISEHCTYYVDGKVPKPEKSPPNG